MSLSEAMTALMDATRNATQLTSKMSINDLTNYVAGLAPINYLDNIVDEQTVETKDGDYEIILSPAQLEEGTYCLSAQLSPTESSVSLRLDFNGGAAQPLSSSMFVHDWGFVGADWINPGEAAITTIPFKVTKAGGFNFGVAGNPFTGGQVKVEKMMLNKGDLPLPFTERMSQPAVNGPLSITYPNWTKASGWGTDAFVIVPVFKGVPICATVEIKDIASTKSDEGPTLLCSYMDKNLNGLSYWDTDSNGDYKLAQNQLLQVGSDDFSNKNGLRSAQRLFTDSNIRNVAYVSIGIGNNVTTTYSFRNLIVSYYKPYSFVSKVVGGNTNQPT